MKVIAIYKASGVMLCAMALFVGGAKTSARLLRSSADETYNNNGNDSIESPPRRVTTNETFPDEGQADSGNSYNPYNNTNGQQNNTVYNPYNNTNGQQNNTNHEQNTTTDKEPTVVPSAPSVGDQQYCEPSPRFRSFSHFFSYLLLLSPYTVWMSGSTRSGALLCSWFE